MSISSRLVDITYMNSLNVNNLQVNSLDVNDLQVNNIEINGEELNNTNEQLLDKDVEISRLKQIVKNQELRINRLEQNLNLVMQKFKLKEKNTNYIIPNEILFKIFSYLNIKLIIALYTKNIYQDDNLLILKLKEINEYSEIILFYRKFYLHQKFYKFITYCNIDLKDKFNSTNKKTFLHHLMMSRLIYKINNFDQIILYYKSKLLISNNKGKTPLDLLFINRSFYELDNIVNIINILIDIINKKLLKIFIKNIEVIDIEKAKEIIFDIVVFNNNSSYILNLIKFNNEEFYYNNIDWFLSL